MRQGRLERTLEEPGCRHLAPTAHAHRLDDATGEHEHGRHLAGGVGMGDRAHGGAAVADGGVRDVAQRLAQEGVRRERPRVPLEPGVPHERTDPHRVVGDVDGIQPGDAVDVDEVAGAGQAHVEHGDQALPAGEHLAVGAGLGQHGHGLVDGLGCVVHERSGFHLFDPACSRGPGKGTAPPERSRPSGGAVVSGSRRAVRAVGRARGRGARGCPGSPPGRGRRHRRCRRRCSRRRP